MKASTMVVAALAVPCSPFCSSSPVLLDVFPMVASGLRDFTQEVLQISYTSLFERSVGCHTVRAGVFQCSPVEVGDTCKVENVIQCPNVTPPPHPMTTAFDCIGAVSSERARDLCPTGLVSTSVKSGMEVTAASTVRGSALLLLILYIPN